MITNTYIATVAYSLHLYSCPNIPHHYKIHGMIDIVWFNDLQVMPEEKFDSPDLNNWMDIRMDIYQLQRMC